MNIKLGQKIESIFSIRIKENNWCLYEEGRNLIYKKLLSMKNAFLNIEYKYEF